MILPPFNRRRLSLLRLLSALVVFTALIGGLAAQTPGPVKIFIMAGQSNTQGHGEISPATTPGTLSYTVANDPSGKYQFLSNGSGGWAVRDDVWIRYERDANNLRMGGLTAGYGASTANTTIGPELGFGHATGNLQDNQILIVKACWGGKSLAVDFRPPSSGGTTGFYYNEILRVVREAITNIGSFSGYNAAAGYQIAGFCWHQGWNDRVDAGYSAQYETNMANLIRDLRSDLGVPGLPFVIASTGMDGSTAYSTVELAQLKMANASAYPEFVGNVAVVDTRVTYDGLDFWQPVALSPLDQGYHWNRNAKTYLHVGLAMGDAMSLLTRPRSPYRLRASGTPSGVTLTWQNGTEIPTSVQVLRNGVEIAAALPANPPTFTDATAEPGVYDYQLVFTMPVTPSNPLSVNFNGAVSALAAIRSAGGVYLSWTNALGYSAIEIRRNGVLIESSLSGSTTSYFDASAPASGLVTYSVVPANGSSTAAEVQINLSAAPSGNAVIYEPFDYPTGGLDAKGGAEVGLTGTWSANPLINLVSGSLAYGSLPTAGNSIGGLGGSANTFGGARPVSAAALSGSGLLADGATLWFSVVVGLGSTANTTNARLAFALASSSFNAGSGQYYIVDDGSQPGSGLGLTLGRFSSNGKVVATQFRDSTRGTSLFEGNVFGTVPTSTIAGGQQRLVVGKITWGAGSDTIELYEPDTNLNLGPVTSTLLVDVNQSTFDTITWTRGDVVTLDEIRFGANYEDVIGASTPAAYWDLDGSTPGAGGSNGSKPAGTWNTDNHWNPVLTGTGTTASWTAGRKAVFAAGSTATGTYAVTIDGTQDIGGLGFEEGTATLTGGTALRMTRNSTIDVKTGLTATIETPLSEDIAGRSLSKEGAGTLVLASSNLYSGTTSVYTGILQANTPGSLPGYGSAAKVLIKGGTLSVPIGSGGWTTGQVDTLLTNATKSSGALGIDTTGGGLTQWSPFTTATGSFGSGLGLTKLGTNTLTLNQANTFSGVTSVNAGTLALTHNLALQNSPLSTGGAGSITMTGMATPTFGGLLENRDLATVLGSGYGAVTMLTLNPASGRLAGYEGVIANGSAGMQLVKTGAGTQVLKGANTYNGATTLRAGTLEVGGESGVIIASNSLFFDGGALTLNYADSDAEKALDRVSDNAPVSSNGGTLTYTTYGAASSRLFGETLGPVTLLSGQLNVVQTLNKISGSQTLVLSALTRPGSTNASAATFSTTSTGPNATTNKIKVNGAGATPAGEIIAPWVTTGTTAVSQTDYAKFDASGNVLPAAMASSAENTWLSATGNYFLNTAATTTLTGNRTINTLRYYGGNSPVLDLTTYNLELNGFLCASTGGAVAFTISSTGGVIRQPGSAPAKLYLTTGSRPLTITAPIQNNVGALTLVKSGSGGTLTLGGAAGSIAYSGDTIVNAGVLQLNSINANNDASTVVIASGGQLVLNFTGSDTVQKLIVGNTRMPNGTYGRTATAATNGGLGVGALDAYFGTTGAGKLTVLDNAAPTWTSGWPKVDSVAATTFTVRANTDETATAYYVVLADGAPAPSAAQVKAGTDSANAPALKSGSIALSATIENSATVSGLTPGTAYDVWLVAQDLVPNLQTTPSKVDVTTLSPFTSWIAGFSVGGQSGLSQDPDGDGKANFSEFALNSNPADGASNGQGICKLGTVNSTPNVLTLTVATRSGAVFGASANNQRAVVAADQLTYLVEASSNLGDWGTPVVSEVTSGDAATIQSGLPALDNGWTYHTFRTGVSAPGAPSSFLRVKVTSP